jgi:hypothetical protein
MTAARNPIVARAWALAAIGLVVAALVTVGVVMASARAGAIAAAEPTPCPDAIACHALKRMPTSVVQP